MLNSIARIIKLFKIILLVPKPIIYYMINTISSHIVILSAYVIQMSSFSLSVILGNFISNFIQQSSIGNIFYTTEILNIPIHTHFVWIIEQRTRETIWRWVSNDQIKSKSNIAETFSIAMTDDSDNVVCSTRRNFVELVSHQKS